MMDKYLDFGRELKILWRKEVNVIIIYDALKTVPKDQEELRLSKLLDQLEYLEKPCSPEVTCT